MNWAPCLHHVEPSCKVPAAPTTLRCVDHLSDTDLEAYAEELAVDFMLRERGLRPLLSHNRRAGMRDYIVKHPAEKLPTWALTEVTEDFPKRLRDTVAAIEVLT